MTDQNREPASAKAGTPAPYVFDWIGSPALAYEHACHAVATMVAKDVRPTRSRLEAVLFIADVGHLNDYGRPLYGENWRAGWSGPVASILGAVLDGSPSAEGALADGDAECVRSARDPDSFADAFRAPVLREMSRSDREAIEDAVDAVAPLGRCDLIRALRAHPAQLVGVGGRISPEAMLRRDEAYEGRVRHLAETVPFLTFLRPEED